MNCVILLLCESLKLCVLVMSLYFLIMLFQCCDKNGNFVICDFIWEFSFVYFNFFYMLESKLNWIIFVFCESVEFADLVCNGSVVMRFK